ncbi:MAG TPA: phosphate acyltransferase PlsX [Emcibacteraceae bacterium]|nr:phosphate acyltransferase PlsX [Emcibacteraceae bacterium]HRW28926.1 phosphate acyltransferase PlsX [Emcibacteraceae bacterium]
MTRELIISLDAMGGDHAPDIVIEGASIARERVPNVRFLIFGDETRIVPLLTRYPILKGCCEVHHTDKIISADEKPSQALRRGRDSSMGQTIQSVKDGKAQAAVLAGNTGAQMALAKFILRTMQGIDRPALATLIPTSRGESVMLDLGANVECDENNLVQFAIMGAAFARTVLGVSKPTVAILNVGVEELKGSDAIKNADRILREANIPMDYKGFTEGHGLGGGAVDVVVTDGFTGNIALKTAEGTARMIANLLKRSLNESLLSKIGALFASSSLMSLRNHLDPNNHNGAVFMGLNGLVIKSHGGASAKGFASAIGVAIDMAENDLAGKITRDLKNFNSTAVEQDEDQLAENDDTIVEMNIKEHK